MTVGDLLFHTAARLPNKEALVYQETRLSYAQLLERTDRLANGLLDLGLRPGDRLGLYLFNSSQAYEALLAGARSGLVFVPLNFMLSGQELATIIRHAGVRAVVTEPDLFHILAPVLPELPALEHIIGLEELPATSVAYEDLIQHAPATPPDVSVRADDLFGLMYTSGTTGLPKGVMLTHRNITAHAEHMVRDYQIGEPSRGFIALPYFVGASLNGIGLPCIAQGGTVIMLRRFTPEIFVDAIAVERITHVQVVPTLLVRLLESAALSAADTSSLEVFGYGSAPMPVDRLKQALSHFGPIFAQMYGLTETCAMATCLRREDHLLDGPEAIRLGSCGRVVEGVEVRLVDAAGNPVQTGEVGEVVIRGPTLMLGYWDMPELSAEAMRDGWFHSGDLAYQDEEGYIFLTDRKKDMIISGGFNVYPKEVEEVLYTHPAVFECAVIGVSDPDWGEAVRAIVALRPGTTATEKELLDFCREHLSNFKRPKSVGFVEEIPRNPSGKVLKRVLREEVLPRNH